MAKVKIELNKQGVRELLRSKEMKAICEAHANKALSRLGDGYAATSTTRQTRVTTSVYAESNKAKKDNLENNTILKALGG